MAQTGFTPIQLYRTATAAAAPTAGNLADGELAINTTDEKLYFKNAAGTVKLLASTAGAAGDVAGPASATDSALVAFDGATGKLIKQAATVTVAQGGTGATTQQAAMNALAGTQTANRVLRSNGTDTTLSQVALTTDVTGTLPVGNGGTGAATLAANNVLLGNGTSALQVVAPGSNGNVLTSNGTTWQSTTPTAGVSLSADNTWTGTQTFAGSLTKEAVVLQNAAETMYIVTGSSTANPTTYIYDGNNYYTLNNSANWTQNLTFTVSTGLNTVMATGQSITIAILSTNGGTAYYPTSVQVDGTTSGVTTRWQGGTAPTSGNANSIDVYSYTIIKTASATFTVLASQTRFA